MPKPVETAAEPPQNAEHEIEERSLAIALRKVADDLFTYEAVAEKAQGREDDEQIEALKNHYKQILVEHWSETAWRTVDDFLAHLDPPQAEPDVPPSPTSEQRDTDQRLE